MRKPNRPALLAAAIAVCFLPDTAAQASPSEASAVLGQSDRQPNVESERAWDATATIFVDWDSNYALTEEDAPAPYQPSPAARGGVAATGSWRFANSERFEAGVGGWFAQTVIKDKYDLTGVSPRLFAAAKFELGERPGRIQLDYRFRRDWLAGDDWESSHGTTLSARLGLTDRWEAGFRYRVDLNDWDAKPPHTYDNLRDAEHHRTGFDARWRAESGRQSFALGYEFIRNLAEEDEKDYDAHGVWARFFTVLPVPIPLGLHLHAAYTSADYYHYPVTPERDARTQFYKARLTLPLTEKLIADLSYALMKVGADDGFFRMKRHLVSGALSYNF
jgi:hypothetical protein